MSVNPDPAQATAEPQADPAQATDGTAPDRASKSDKVPASSQKSMSQDKPADHTQSAEAERVVRVANTPPAYPAKVQPLKAHPVAATTPQKLPAKTAKSGALTQTGATPPPPTITVRPAVQPAKPQRRHWVLLASFLALVILPTLIWAWYLYSRASDQYVSSIAFSVRQEDSQPAMDVLGGLAALGGVSSGAADTDILYQYILSQDMVDNIDKKINLRADFSREWPRDFVFAFNPKGTIEDLTNYWGRQVSVHYDSSVGLITLHVSAFTPESAQQIAKAILEESTAKINELSAVAREDSMRLARAELEKTRIELTTSRQEMTRFRMRTQIVDPQADLAGQMGVLTQLQSQLAEQMLQLDMLAENAQPSDNRVLQAQQKEAALRKLIASERDKFGREGHGPGGESYAELVAEFEKLAVDREFAEGAYRSARINYELALADAQRQSRYLAAHITPRVPQASVEPRRLQLLGLIAGLLLIAWSIMTLIYYSIRDRG